MGMCVVDRSEELQRIIFGKNEPYYALIDFLDSINSIEELDLYIMILGQADKMDVYEWYRNNLSRWPTPQLPEGFKEKCPRLTKLLDTPQKIRILLRGADFRDVDPLLMGEVLEDIIYQHEEKGLKRVVYKEYRETGNKRHDALRIVYHTQIQANTLTRLALVGFCSAGGGTGGLFVEWP